MDLMSTFTLATLTAKLIVVGVIDTGLKSKYANLVACDVSLNKDFTGHSIEDVDGHGTNVAGLIHNQIFLPKRYCQITIKFWHSTESSENKAYFDALDYASTLNLDYLNLSINGPVFLPQEAAAIRCMLNRDRPVKIVVAAGNEGKNLDYEASYPASLDARLIVVGNTRRSNYGKLVDVVIDGERKTAFDETRSGSSMSAAIYTGMLINKEVH